MKEIRILLADDHEVVRRGLCTLLQAQPGWKVVAEAANGREAVDLARQFKPAVVILDISMPEVNGFEATRQILKAIPQTEVLILTMHESEQVVREVLDAGARGYVLKSDAGQDMVAAVESLSRHKPFFTSKVAEMVLEGYRKKGLAESKTKALRSSLTPREREIVQLLAEGKSNKEVAAALGISIKTTETHRANIMRKLNLQSISDLVRYAIRNKIIQT
jgi:DNA-binding NarL/FixJ family response regulator